MSETPAAVPTEAAPTATQTVAPEAKPEPPTPTFSQAEVDRIVKERLSREGIADLKAKAAKLDEMTEAQKTAEQKVAEALAKAQRDTESLTVANQRLTAAVDHGVDKDHRDLIGGTTAEEIATNAQRIGALLRDRAELAAAKAELEALKAGKTVPSNVPIASLRPGATPVAQPLEDDAFPAHWIPQRAN